MKPGYRAYLPQQMKTVAWITISWTIISMMQLTYEIAILKEYGFNYRWSESGSFMTYFLINTFSFVLNGFIGGIVIVFLLQNWFRRLSYRVAILYGILLYVSLFILLTCLQNYFVVDSIWDGIGSFFDAYIQGLKDYFFSYEFVRIFTFWFLVLIGTLITLFVNDKYGPGVFRKFLLGKYFHPKREERIFMFLDLKGSTPIAEKLGEFKYFKFIQKAFRDMTPIILRTKGDIYQYVGDEIVISWKVKSGITDSNCIQCFLQIQELLKSLAPSYYEQFGEAPEFKAGIHVGNAIAGEVGVIKRELAFSGDVLNTTARIQSKCNELGTMLLLSGDLVALLPEGPLKPKPIGKVALRGKAESLPLFTL